MLKLNENVTEKIKDRPSYGVFKGYLKNFYSQEELKDFMFLNGFIHGVAACGLLSYDETNKLIDELLNDFIKKE